MKTQSKTELKLIYAIAGMEEADSPATWSHPHSSESVTKVWNNGIESGWSKKVEIRETNVHKHWNSCTVFYCFYRVIPRRLNFICHIKIQTLGNHQKERIQLEGCLTVHLPHEIIWNANLMQQGNFIDLFLARHVSGTYAHHQEH